jgi:hypothetical protein
MVLIKEIFKNDSTRTMMTFLLEIYKKLRTGLIGIVFNNSGIFRAGHIWICGGKLILGQAYLQVL